MKERQYPLECNDYVLRRGNTKHDIYYVPRTVPRNVIPPVKVLFREMINQSWRYVDLGEKSGLSPHTIRNWRTRNTPDVASLEACLNVVGFTLQAVRSKVEEDTHDGT